MMNKERRLKEKEAEAKKRFGYIQRVNQKILAQKNLSALIQYILEEGIKILQVEAACLRFTDTLQNPFVTKAITETASFAFSSPSPGTLAPFLTLPIKAKDKTLGTLSFYSKTKRESTLLEMQIANIIASQSALAIIHKTYVEKIKKLAAIDTMTELYNQNYFYKRLEEEIARVSRNKQPLSLLFMDVDKLKAVNDSFGHLRGDKVLQFIAKNIKRNVRKMDIVFRYGGDEFVVILPGIGTEKASLIAERIRKKTKEHTPFPAISLSLGIASFPKDAKKPRELLDRADQAMYQAKWKGGDRVEKIMHKKM